MNSLNEVMRRIVANHGADSRKAAYDAFLAEMKSDAKYLDALAREHFDREFPKWERKEVAPGSNVIVPPRSSLMEIFASSSPVGFSVASRRSPQVSRENKAQRAAEINRQAAAIAHRVRRVVLMDLRLPCGKLLRDATFADCANAGGWFVELARHGKPSEAVDKKLSEADLQNIWSRFDSKAERVA